MDILSLPNLFIFEIVLAFLDPLCFHIILWSAFRFIKYFCNFDRDCTEFIDQFGKYGYLNNVPFHSMRVFLNSFRSFTLSRNVYGFQCTALVAFLFIFILHLIINGMFWNFIFLRIREYILYLYFDLESYDLPKLRIVWYWIGRGRFIRTFYMQGHIIQEFK